MITWQSLSSAVIAQQQAASDGLQITERFAREYEEATGQPVRFRLSFGSSGTQARAVCDGLPADIGKVALFPVLPLHAAI